MKTTEYAKCYLQRKKTFRSQGLRVYVLKSVGEQSRKGISGNRLVGKCCDTRKNRTGISVDTSLGIFGCTFATKISIHDCHHF